MELGGLELLSLFRMRSGHFIVDLDEQRNKLMESLVRSP
jgi:hypothetical protein